MTVVNGFVTGYQTFTRVFELMVENCSEEYMMPETGRVAKLLRDISEHASTFKTGSTCCGKVTAMGGTVTPRLVLSEAVWFPALIPNACQV